MCIVGVGVCEYDNKNAATNINKPLPCVCQDIISVPQLLRLKILHLLLFNTSGM